MTPEERDLIAGVGKSLRAADRSWKDPEADRLIRAEVEAQPDAVYLLTQRVIVTELALKQAQARIDALESQVRPAPGGRGFLPGSAGAGEPPVAQPAHPPQAYPVGGPPQQGQSPSGGGAGGFLKTAAAAAAGTIGGQLIYDGIRHMASGGLPNVGGIGGIGGGFLPGGFPHVGGHAPPPRFDDAGDAPVDLSGHESRGGDVGGGTWDEPPAAGADDVGGGDFGEAPDAGDDVAGGDFGDDEPTDAGTDDVGGGDFGDSADNSDASDTGGDGGGGGW